MCGVILPPLSPSLFFSQHIDAYCVLSGSSPKADAPPTIVLAVGVTLNSMSMSPLELMLTVVVPPPPRGGGNGTWGLGCGMKGW